MAARRRILIVHQNFPGQFPHIADALLARGDKVVAIGGRTAKPPPPRRSPPLEQSAQHHAPAFSTPRFGRRRT
jgi:hypothetical protein